MGGTNDKARAVFGGNRHLLGALATSLIRVERDNLVERPWGGDWIRRFKRIPEAGTGTVHRFGEAFEISAFGADEEARRYPSRVRFDDGSIIDLPALLDVQAEALLGQSFVERYGACFPLLPKTLDVKELLSVQGHPRGHTEVYIIIDAEPAATLRLGFNRDIDPAAMTRELSRGLEQQNRLLEALGPATDPQSLQQLVAPWLAARDAGTAEIESRLESVAQGRCDAARPILAALKDLYWRVLDSMNAIEVQPGQVIHNSTPKRLLAGDDSAAAEVHALGNPESREILALEIRRPGPTFRAWDNVRFPPREVDVTSAIAALNLRATLPEEFLVERRPVPGRSGAFVSVDSEYFRVEHLAPGSSQPVSVPASGPHSLHCLAGAVDVFATAGGQRLGRLERGESALVPVGVGAYVVESTDAAEVVRALLPEH